MEASLCSLLILIVLVPICLILSLVIILAATGRSVGIRKKYIEVLLKVFEFGRERINSYAASERDKRQSELVEDDEGLPDMDSNTDSDADSENSNLITRDISISALEGIKIPSNRSDYDLTWRRDFHISDVMYFAKCGTESIIQDDVTQRFAAEELKSWNLLTRTDKGYHFHISMRLMVLWWLGCFFRYCILMPFRMVLCFSGLGFLITTTFLIGYIPESNMKKRLNRFSSLMSHRILCRAMSALVTFHNKENCPPTGICVANHTSPIDVIILSSDNCYAMVGQGHSGFLGIMQRALSRATHHIWFERSEMKDRLVVLQRMKEHVENKDKLPILIFPEGTCVNNTSVMMFKKGGFEVSPVVYPVAIKYDSRFGDAFWNSSKESMVHHLFNIMTSWAMVANVWYLPPVRKREDENAVQFANRVKQEIANQGGLVDLEWDGQLKRMKAKDTWKMKSQSDYSNLIKKQE